MRRVALKSIATLALGLGATGLTLVPAHAEPTTYYPSGPQVNVAVTEVTNGGWTLCWSETYDLESSVEEIIAGTDDNSVGACDSDLVLLTGWANSSANTLITLAAAPRSEVFEETPMSDINGNILPKNFGAWTSACISSGSVYTNPHEVNGTFWYYTPGCSMGFSPTEDLDQWPGDSIWEDGTQPKRLSWHMWNKSKPNHLQGGFSLGSAVSLNAASDYTRAIYTAMAPVEEESIDSESGESGPELADTGSSSDFNSLLLFISIGFIGTGFALMKLARRI